MSQPTRQMQSHLTVDNRAYCRGHAQPRLHKKIMLKRRLRSRSRSLREIVQGYNVLGGRTLVGNGLEPGTIAIEAPGKRRLSCSVYPLILDGQPILFGIPARDFASCTATDSALPDRLHHDCWL